jgi:Recombinase
VEQVLTNEKYIGNNVYNRRSGKLSKRRTPMPPEMWIRADEVFPAIVDPELFAAAGAELAKRNRRPTDDEMLAGLRELYEQRGHLSSIIINEAKHLPASLTYRTRFGGLGRAYQLIGYGPYRATASVEINRTLRRLYAEVHDEVLGKIEKLGGTVAGDGKKDLITVNDEFTCSIVIARCTSTRGQGLMRWNVRLDTLLRPDITIAVRLGPDNQQAMDYYVLPQIDMTGSRLRLAERNGVFLDAYRSERVDRFCELSARTRLRFGE